MFMIILFMLEVKKNMIVDKNQMRKIEEESSFTTLELMEKAGTVLANAITKRITKKDHILILCGCGNNGGDGLVLARLLSDFDIRVILIDGNPKTTEAKLNYDKLSSNIIINQSFLSRELKWATIIIDCIYGIGFHCPLDLQMKSIFKKINNSNKTIYSVDINSGCECDSGNYDSNAIRSDITFALDCIKPFHLLFKEHLMFKEGIVLSMNLPHKIKTKYFEMNEDIFFKHFNKKPVNAYKGKDDKILIVGGCYGMAGAVSLNIIGARTVGSSYIHVALPEEIYPIVSNRFITAVYHPFGYQTASNVIEPLIKESKAIAFGSGAVYMPHKELCLDLILQESTVPVVLDAEGLRMLHQNTYILKFVKEPVILTPHLGEFADILNIPTLILKENKLKYAQKFSKEYNVYVVLKGANTIVASPNGEIYINQSGNQALAQAGSGDLLTGIMTGLLAIHHNVFEAICMAVWLHGHLADVGIQNNSIQAFNLEYYPKLMDELFKKHNL